MAKLNWQKLHQQSKAQQQREKSPTDHYLDFDSNGLWSMKGKYYGTHVTKLPLNYLGWVIDNNQGKHKGIAEAELYRRYNELSNT